MLTSSLARVAIGAEAQGRAKVTARVGIGAEARGSTGTRALVAIGAETGGAFADNLTYANGFAHRIVVEVPAERVEATTTGFLFYFDETYPELRTTGNGGLVQNASGFDQRWTLGDDTVLAYRRVSWSATTGRHIARVLIPSVTAGQPVRLILYFGKSVASDEQQATAAYAGYALALNTRTGEDLTGQGRDLTPTSVGTGTLIGDAGSYNGTSSRLERAGLTALDGLPAITVEAWVNASSIGHSGAIVAGGPTTATADGAMGMVLRFDKVGNDTIGDNCIAFKIQAADGTTRFESTPNVQATGATYLAGQYQPGQAPRAWLNDAFLAQANTPVIRTGAANVVRGGSLWVGFSPITDTDSVVDPPPPPDAGRFLNPFNMLSAHHRPIGNGVKYGIPPAQESNDGTPRDGIEFTGTNIAARGRLATLRSFVLQVDHRSVKCFMNPIIGDSRMVTKSIVDRDGTRSWLMPNNSVEIFPPNSAGGERQVLLYPIDGAGNQAVLWNQFSYISETANIRRVYRLDGMDAFEPGTSTSVGDAGTSAARIRWPFGLLRGFEVNGDDPGPIGHSFTLTATRQDQPAADHVIGRTRCWPAYGVDASLITSAGAYAAGENLGDIPYGCCITFTPDDYFDNILPPLVAANNKRGIRVVEAIYYYGMYMMDGGGEPNVIKIRCDQNVGFRVRTTADANGEYGRQIIAGVRDQIEAALEIARPYLMPVFNPQTYNTANRQLVRGFPFVGGGTGNGVRNALAPAMSRNTAFDAPSPGYPTGPV